MTPQYIAAHFVKYVTGQPLEYGEAMNHLNERILGKVKERLWNVSSSLNGIGKLFQKEENFSICMDADESFGIGTYLKKQAEELSILEDILNCGYDSMADKRNGLDLEEEFKEEQEKSSH